MISNEISSKGEIGTVPADPTPLVEDSSGGCAVLNATPLPLPTSEAPSIPSHPLSIPGSRFSESYVASSSGYRPVEENDIVIAVMGPTGAGKSSFVNTAAGREEVVIGNSLKSQTRTVQPVRCRSPDGRNIVLVDTPGFDDTYLSDVQVLKIIASWLKETYQNDVKLSGLLYLHRISDVRFSGTPLRNLSVFKDLCGEKNLHNVVLVTTMWDELQEELVGSKREDELLTSFWKGMIRFGSRSCRFQGTQESAWDILKRLNLENDLQGLQIQREMVDRGLQVHETTAAKTLLGFLLAEFKKFWGRVRTGTWRVTGLDGLRRRFPGGSSTSITSSSGSSLHVSSPTDSSSLFFNHPASPAGSTSTGCGVDDRRPTLISTITGLGLAHQVADITGIPILRGTIGTALHIAQTIEGMGGTHHAICQVIEQSGWLLKEIAQYATEHKLPRDMRKMLKSLKKELDNVQKVVMKISSRRSIARFFLHDADVQTIAACTALIKAIYAKIEVKIAIDNRQALARLEDQLEEIRKDMKLRQCQCGVVVLAEQENREPSAVATTSQAFASCD